jgi:hypothetical protein
MTGKDDKPKSKREQMIFRKGQEDILQKLANLLVKERYI